MYQIEKILNNNTVLVSDDETEGVVIYKGIGFGRRNGEEIKIPGNAKLYIMQKSHKSQERIEKIKDIEPVYIEIAHEVLKYAQEKYNLNVHGQLTPLTMTIYFSIKLLNEHDDKSDIFNDFNFFYPREYDIALKAKEIIQKYANIVIDDNQTNHIAVHLNSCFFRSRADVFENIMQVVSCEISDIEKDLNIKVNRHSVSFVRLLRHIRFNLDNPKRQLIDINSIIFQEYPYVYDKAKNIVNKLSEALGEKVQEKEIGYISLHIEELIISAHGNYEQNVN
ncbi:MAG: PRD domain-containing protein [Erysipelotrichaceae bacterium]|nr:PRD domain-containing protein [Erysipelotrichaceae bacterium]